jgi:selenocysteine lyase/cysteine desulfurase
VTSFLAAIHSDEDLRRHEFPIARTRAYFAHAAVGPFPRRVVDAVAGYLARASAEGPFEHLHAEDETAARRLAAELLGASPDEIAFTSSTSAGLSTVASGLDWRPGDRVLIREGDFPANVQPWLALRDRGVEIDRIPWSDAGAVSVADVAGRLASRTRLVALSSVDYLTGAAAPLDEIGSFLRARGVLFCVDAIQSLGVLPCSVEHVDFLAADAHKWLLGPQGAAVLYVGSEHVGELRPLAVGWKSVRSPRDYFDADQPLAPTARRFEPGGLNVLGLVGLRAALELVATVGLTAIRERVVSNRERIAAGLAELGHAPLGGPRSRGSIVSFRPRDARGLHRRLDAAGIVTSLRLDRQGAPCIRIAPHYYTTEREVEALLEHVARERKVMAP